MLSTSPLIHPPCLEGSKPSIVASCQPSHYAGMNGCLPRAPRTQRPGFPDSTTERHVARMLRVLQKAASPAEHSPDVRHSRDGAAVGPANMDLANRSAAPAGHRQLWPLCLSDLCRLL